MACTRLFPRAKPRAQIEFLDEHLLSISTEVDDEIRVAQMLAALTMASGTRYPPPKFETVDQKQMPVKWAMGEVLSQRTLHASKLTLSAWSRPDDWDHKQRLYRVFGVLCYIVRDAPFFQSSTFKLHHAQVYHAVEYMHTLMIVALEWADAMTGSSHPAQLVPADALSAEPNHTPLINWKAQAVVYHGMQAYHEGDYTNARKKFKRAEMEFLWKPSPEMALFLESPSTMYATDIHAASSSAALAVAASLMPPNPKKTQVEACLSPVSPPANAVSVSRTGISPLSEVSPFTL